MDNLVIQQNNQPITTSRMVARKFNKRHAHVLRDIERIVKQTGSLNSKLGSVELGQPNFGLSSYVNEQNKDMPEYHITKDGFALLAMGFTGKKALEFKISIMNEFNRMQEEINQLKNGAEVNQLKEQINELVLQYTVSGSSRQYGMMFLNDDAKTFTLHQAKNLIVPKARKWSYQLFVDSLEEIKALDMGVPTDDFIENGTFNHRYTRKLADGELEEKHFIRVTSVGLLILSEKLGFLSENKFDDDLIEKYRNCQLTFDDYRKQFKTLESIGHELITHHLPNSNQLPS